MTLAPLKTPTSLQFRRTYSTTPEQLFAAWTTPEAMNQWLHPNDQLTTQSTVDLKIGGELRIEMHPPAEAKADPYVVVGNYREIDAPHKVAFTWRWLGEAHESLVTVEIVAVEEGAELTLTHSQLANAEERDNHGIGWDGTFAQFEAYLSRANQ